MKFATKPARVSAGWQTVRGLVVGRNYVVVGLSVGQGSDLEMTKPINGDRSCWDIAHR